MMKFKKILCNLIVLSLLLCSCGKKESLVNNVSAKENEVKKNEIVESKKNNEIVESEDVVKLKSELAESQDALEKEKKKADDFFFLVITVPIVAGALVALYYENFRVQPMQEEIE